MVTTLESSNFGKRRKFFLGQAENFEKALSAANRGGVLAIDVELNFARGQLANDGEEAARRERGGAFFFDLRFEAAAHADIEIGRRQANFTPVGLQEDVGKNRQRGARADDVLNLLQTFEKLFFRNAKFHEGGWGSLRCKAFDFIRQPQSRSAFNVAARCR